MIIQECMPQDPQMQEEAHSEVPPVLLAAGSPEVEAEAGE